MGDSWYKPCPPVNATLPLHARRCPHSGSTASLSGAHGLHDAPMKGEMVLLARIGAAHGVRGEVRVKSFTAIPTALGEYGPLTARDGRTFVVERLRPAKEVVVAKFRGIDDRGTAEALNGTDLYVPRQRLPAEEEDEYYHSDLIGLAAATEAGEPLGTVVAVHDFGAGDILEIAPSRGPTLMLPFTREAVPAIDLAARSLIAVPPPDVEADEDEPNNLEETQ